MRQRHSARDIQPGARWSRIPPVTKFCGDGAGSFGTTFYLCASHSASIPGLPVWMAECTGLASWRPLDSLRVGRFTQHWRM